MKKLSAFVILVLVVLAVVLVGASAYTVDQTQQAIITQFGKPIGQAVTEAGLHWRKPFIQKVHLFEKRLLEHDGEKREIPTLDKKFIEIDTFARWKIVDPLQFFKSVKGDELEAKKKLDDIIDSETRNAISSHILIEAVRNSDRQLPVDAEIAEVGTTLEDIIGKEGKAPEGEAEASRGKETATFNKGREAIAREIFDKSKKKIEGFGIELVDVQIKAINYVSRVQEKVFERMVSEREQIAEKYRAEGQKLSFEIMGRIEKEKNRILSEAYRQSETIKGEAEAEAARIYADAYGKDPEFYSFWKTLEIYRESLGENLSLVISTSSELFRYLRGTGISSVPDTNE
jgi:membrane protease subunit HflC